MRDLFNAEGLGWIFSVIGLTLVFIIYKISRHRKVEDGLRRTNKEKDEFLAMLAHELRNPLVPIQNCARILSKDVDPETCTWARDTIMRQVEHMSRLVNDLLDVSRIMRGKVVLKPNLTDLTSILFRAIETAKPLIEEHGQRFILCVPNVLVELFADEVRLSQVISNLLTNAAKYTEPGGTITLTGVYSSDIITITVKDTGIGIAPEHLGRIFSSFFQVDQSLDRAKGGLGIGLAIVKTLVEMHKGTVEVRSVPHQGSEFIVTIPIGKRPTMSTAPTMKSGVCRRKILVVDDNIDVAKSLAIMIRQDGHQALFAFDGPAALDVCKTFVPDIILLDIGLPGMNGYEVAAKLREADSTCRRSIIVAMTGYGSDEDRRKSHDAGMNEHFVKPVRYELLEEIFQRPLLKD